MAKRKRVSKRYIRLTEDINAIPEGVYRYQGSDEFMFYLDVGDKVLIGLPKEAAEYLRFVPSGTPRTPLDDFLGRYEIVASGQPPKDCKTVGAYSFCAIDPSIKEAMN